MVTVLPIYLRTALHDLNFGYLAQKRYKNCEFEYTGIPTKIVKKKTTFHVASLQQSFLLNPNIQYALHIFTIKKIFTKVEPW